MVRQKFKKKPKKVKKDPFDSHIHFWKTVYEPFKQKKCTICQETRPMNRNIIVNKEISWDTKRLKFKKGTCSGPIILDFEIPNDKLKKKKVIYPAFNKYQICNHFIAWSCNERYKSGIFKNEKRDKLIESIKNEKYTPTVYPERKKIKKSWLLKPPSTIIDNYIKIIKI